MKRQQYVKPASVTDLREHGRIVLAHGEVTGHSHTVYADAETDLIPDAEYFQEPDGRQVLLARKSCMLRHQEHGAIELVPEDAARGARGECDAAGRLLGQYRQGDVFCQPIGWGAWAIIRQSEYVRGELRRVAD